MQQRSRSLTHLVSPRLDLGVRDGMTLWNRLVRRSASVNGLKVRRRGRVRSTRNFIHRQECLSHKSKKKRQAFDLPQMILLKLRELIVSWQRLSSWLCRFLVLLFWEPPWPGLSLRLRRRRRAG